MELRLLKKQDVKQLIQLCELHATFEKTSYDSTNKSELLVTYFLDDSNAAKCIVAEENDILVGYATFMKQFSTWDASYYIYLDCLFFKEEIRGQGLGTKMMQKIKMYAITEKCDMIQWQTPNFNTKAIDFYQKIGAKSKLKERFFWTL